MDALFLVFFTWTFYFLWKGRESHPWGMGALGGLAASVAAFFTFSAAVLALWAVVVWIGTCLFDRKRMTSTTKTLLSAGCVSLVFYAGLYLLTGYRLFHVLQAAIEQHHTIMSGGGHETLVQYGNLVAANMIAFLFGAGVVLTALVVLGKPGLRWWNIARQTTGAGASERHSGDLFTGKLPAGGRLFTGCFAVTLIVTAALPLYTLEVERIWLFFVPLLAISAARTLNSSDAGFSRLALTAFGLQAIQTVAMEVFLCTIW